MTNRHIGNFPADYGDFVAAAAASSSGDTWVVDTAQTYAAQDLSAYSALSNITVRDTVAGDYVCELDTSSLYALSVGPGWEWTHGTIEADINTPVYAGAGCTVVFTGVTFDLSKRLPAQAMAWSRGAGASITMSGCRFTGDADTNATGIVLCRDGGAAVVENCYLEPQIVPSIGAYRVFSGTCELSVRGCNSASADLVVVTAGATVSTLTVQGSYAPHLVTNGGTITAFDGADNVYDTTDAGTTGTRDTDGVTDFDVDENGAAWPTSPLYRKCPAGVQYGGNYDALGNPRQRGGRQDCGPVQNQRIGPPLRVAI